MQAMHLTKRQMMSGSQMMKKKKKIRRRGSRRGSIIRGRWARRMRGKRVVIWRMGRSAMNQIKKAENGRRIKNEVGTAMIKEVVAVAAVEAVAEVLIQEEEGRTKVVEVGVGREVVAGSINPP